MYCELSFESCVERGCGRLAQLCCEIPSRILWRTLPKPQFVLMNASTQTRIRSRIRRRQRRRKKKQSIRVHLQKWHFHSHFSNFFSMVGKFSCLLGYEIRNDVYAKNIFSQVLFDCVSEINGTAVAVAGVASDVPSVMVEMVMMLAPLPVPLQLGMCCALSIARIIFRKSEIENNTKFELKLTPESKRHNRLVRSSSKQ